MPFAADDPDAEQPDRGGGVLRRPVRIPVPGALRQAVESGHRELAGKVVNVTARVLAIVLPAALAVVGLAVALAGAALSTHAGTEAIGSP